MNKEERANAFAIRIMDYFMKANTDNYVEDIGDENDINVSRLFEIHNYAYQYFLENRIGD